MVNVKRNSTYFMHTLDGLPFIYYFKDLFSACISMRRVFFLSKNLARLDFSVFNYYLFIVLF